MRPALLTALVLALAGCGQKGALYFATPEADAPTTGPAPVQAPAEVPANTRTAEPATADDNEEEAGDTPAP